jgi:hypothetical protein
LKINDLVTRIKWQPVLALLLVIVAAAYLLFGGPVSSPFQDKWKGDGDIQEMSWADPASVETDGTARAKVIVRNVGEDAGNVTVKLVADDASLAFEEGNNSQELNSPLISLGPEEVREMFFKVNFNAAYAGKYRVAVTVYAPGGNIQDEIFFDVKEKK